MHTEEAITLFVEKDLCDLDSMHKVVLEVKGEEELKALESKLLEGAVEMILLLI